MPSKDIWNHLTPSGNYGVMQPQQPPNMANSAASLNSNNAIDPFARGQYYGRVYDPRTQMGGQEMNILGINRQQDI